MPESTSNNAIATLARVCRPAYIGWLARHWLPLSLLTLLVAVVHGPSVRYDFVNWDDSWYVTDNALIHSWSLENLYGIATQPVARNFAPLTVFTLLIDHTFWGLNPAGYHLTNVLLHGINAILVWWLVRRLVKDDSIALVTAVLFSVHPVQVESVAWISSRKTLLSTTCMLASGLCWLRSDRAVKGEMWGTLWLLLGLLSKASAVVVPPIVLLYDVLIRRQRLSDAIPRQLVPGFLCLVCVNLTMGAQTTIVGGIRDHIGLDKMNIIGIDSLLLFRYLRMLVWPSDLAILYDVPIEGIFWPALFATSFWLCVAAMLWRYRERCPWITWLAACWILLLFPMLNFFPLTTLINDRYLYLPCVPIFVAALCGLKWCANRIVLFAAIQGRFRRLATAAGATVLASAIAMSSLASAAQAEIWRNPLSLWGETMQHVPQLAVVRIQWAISLQESGRTSEAREVLQAALDECEMDEHDRKRILDKLAEWRDEPSS
jgi:hypothetical protein